MKLAAITSLLLAGTPVASMAHPGHQGEHEPPAKTAQTLIAVQYSGFDCAPCAEVSELLNRLAEEKQLALQVIFKHSPGSPGALEAHEAALAAGQQGKFWEFHDLLFANPDASHSQLMEFARTLELDVERFGNALDERVFRSKVLSDMSEGRGIGIKVAPTVFLNGTKLEGIDQLRSFVEFAINPLPSGLDPDKIHTFDLAGSPATGPDNAPITIVEFSDYRCGFCGVNSRSITTLMEAYPGQIRRVFKHFPIEGTENGTLPHRGAMAAMAQGRFWDLHRALMNQALKGEDDLRSRAVAIGLDMDHFHQALAGGEFLGLLERDVKEGEEAGIRSTPTTFINGRALSGRQSLRNLKRVVNGILGIDDPGLEASMVIETPSRGPENSPVLIEFFCDYAQPESQGLATVLDDFLEQNAETRVEVHLLPRPGDAASAGVHQFAAAAVAQDKFWTLHPRLLARDSLPSQRELRDLAIELGLDLERLGEDIADRLPHSLMEASSEKGADYRLNERPALIVNGQTLKGIPSVRELTALYDKECCAKRETGSGTASGPEFHTFETKKASP
ncbi:hypothetical protein BH23VER1_BH23VER1_09300 [soil metagenome]